MVRMSAADRREAVLRAAIAEFARQGYHATSTGAIARRVGVSQPYLFRLFPDKKAIFVAAALRSLEDTRLVMEEAARGLEGTEARSAMGQAYARLITERPDRLAMQLQSSVTVAAAEAAGDRTFGEAIRAGWTRLWETAHAPLGADATETSAFMACGMLLGALTTMGFPPGHRVWEWVGSALEPPAPTTGPGPRSPD
ncbi:TetR/AcrR family transcriptional regulator [Streptomyces sp. NPDC001492]